MLFSSTPWTGAKSQSQTLLLLLLLFHLLQLLLFLVLLLVLLLVLFLFRFQPLLLLLFLFILITCSSLLVLLFHPQLLCCSSQLPRCAGLGGSCTQLPFVSHLDLMLPRNAFGTPAVRTSKGGFLEGGSFGRPFFFTYASACLSDKT